MHPSASSSRSRRALSSTPPRANRRSAVSASASSSASHSKRQRPNEVFAVGVDVKCKWLGDDEEHEARILQIRKTEGGQNEYYVHYLGFDHRLDEWVPVNRLKPMKASSASATSPRDTDSRRRKARDEALKQLTSSALSTRTTTFVFPPVHPHLSYLHYRFR